MSDLTAWVPLWEKCPELVPGGWKYGLTSWKGVAWHRAEDTQEWLVTEAEPIDIDAQLGTAVQWLASRDAYAVATIEAGPDIAATLGLLRVRVEANLPTNNAKVD